ncbi:MAG: hypothetical protein ACKOYI_15625 [Actinomycetota bacterium]
MFFYLIQTSAVATALLIILRHQHVFLRIQVVLWAIGAATIAWRFGVVGQLDFYSNDQRYYNFVVEMYSRERWILNEELSFVDSKTPYTLPAVLVRLLGFHPTLALKIVSLVSLLTLSHLILKRYDAHRFSAQVKLLYFTACGAIGTFFSMLALRETTMMLFAYLYTFGKAPQLRLTSLILLFLLRPHLAAALFVAELITSGWKWITAKRDTGFFATPAVLTMSVAFGTVLYTLQNVPGSQDDDPAGKNVFVAQAIRIVSNFVGLQFLTVPESTVNFSISSLVLLRFILSETVIIPTFFTLICVLRSFRLRDRELFVLSAFALYVSVVTNTDFNSFRQNVPFIPLMGIVIIDYLCQRATRKVRLNRYAPVNGWLPLRKVPTP